MLEPNRPSVNAEISTIPAGVQKEKKPFFPWLFGSTQEEKIPPVLSSHDAATIRPDYSRLAKETKSVQNEEIKSFILATTQIAADPLLSLHVDDSGNWKATIDGLTADENSKVAQKSAKILNKYYNRFINPRGIDEKLTDEQIAQGVLSDEDAASFITAYHDLCSYFESKFGSEMKQTFQREVLFTEENKLKEENKLNVEGKSPAKVTKNQLNDSEKSLIEAMRTIRINRGQSKLYLTVDEKGKFSATAAGPNMTALFRVGDILNRYRNSLIQNASPEDNRPVLDRRDEAAFITTFYELKREASELIGKDSDFGEYFLGNAPCSTELLEEYGLLKEIRDKGILAALKDYDEKTAQGKKAYINITSEGMWSVTDERIPSTAPFSQVQKIMRELLYDNPLGKGSVDSSFYRMDVNKLEALSGEERLAYNVLRDLDKRFNQIEKHATSLTKHGWRPLRWAGRNIAYFFKSVYSATKNVFSSKQAESTTAAYPEIDVGSSEPKITPKSSHTTTPVPKPIELLVYNRDDSSDVVKLKQKVNVILSSLAYPADEKLKRLEELKEKNIPSEQKEIVEETIKRMIKMLIDSTSLHGNDNLTDLENRTPVSTSLRSGSQYGGEEESTPMGVIASEPENAELNELIENTELQGKIREILRRGTFDPNSKIGFLELLKEGYKEPAQIKLIDEAIAKQQEALARASPSTPSTFSEASPGSSSTSPGKSEQAMSSEEFEIWLKKNVEKMRSPAAFSFKELEELFGPLEEPLSTTSPEPQAETEQLVELEESGLAPSGQVLKEEPQKFDDIFNDLLSNESLLKYHQSLVDQRKLLQDGLKEISQKLGEDQSNKKVEQEKAQGITETLKLIGQMIDGYARIKEKYAKVSEDEKEAKKSELLNEIADYKKEATHLGYNERGFLRPVPPMK